MSWPKRLLFSLWYRFGHPPWDTGQSPPELLEVLEQLPPGRALDLGCGTGTNAITMARFGWEVVAVDLAGPAIARARARARQAGLEVRFEVADAARLPFVTGPFELILDIGCLHGLGLPERRRYLAEAVRLTEPGSILLLHALYPRRRRLARFGLEEAEVTRLCEGPFELQRLQRGRDDGSRSAWYTFRRR